MTGWNDERLGTLLRDTFASHEALADPDRAAQLARESLNTTNGARHRWWGPVAAAAVLVLAVSGVTALVQHGDHAGHDRRAPTAGVSTGVPKPNYWSNHGDANRATREMARFVPLPAGAVERPAEPSGWVENGLAIPGRSDPSLTHTTWWSVPASPTTVRAYLLAHDPPDSTHEDNVDDSSTGRGVITYDLTYVQRSSPEPQAYVPVELVVAWQRHARGTLVRADAYTAARDVRDRRTLVGSGATSVELVRQPATHGLDPAPQPRVRVLRAPGDRSAIDRLVTVLDALPGSARSTDTVGCPVTANPPPSDTVTVHRSDGPVLELTLLPACFGQVQVSVDGHGIRSTLDPGDLDRLVQQLVPGGR